jgi:purine-cytosine permease-like protein
MPGAYGAATLGKTANVFEVASGSPRHFICCCSWFIALDNWTINVLNLYTGGLSLEYVERLGAFGRP